MGNIPLLDLVIGLSFIYLLLALVCTTIIEWIAQRFDSRGDMLKRGVTKMLGEDEKSRGVAEALFSHPLIAGLKSDTKPPSYIPSDVFAKALLAILRSVSIGDGSERRTLQRSPDLTAALRALAPAQAEGHDAADALPGEDAIASWFESAMQRLSGTYKRSARRRAFWVAVAITLLLNVDSIALTGRLWQNASLRTYLVERAKVRLAQGPPLETVEYTEPDSPAVTPPVPTDTTRSTDQLLDEEIDLLGRLFGWDSGVATFFSRGAIALFWSLVGWTITALAVSLGAPFWFDTLNKFMNFRAAGAVPAPKKQEEVKR